MAQSVAYRFPRWMVEAGHGRRSRPEQDLPANILGVVASADGEEYEGALVTLTLKDTRHGASRKRPTAPARSTS